MLARARDVTRDVVNEGPGGTGGEALRSRILRATLKSVANRDKYADQRASTLSQTLYTAQQDVTYAITRYKSMGSLPANRLAAKRGLDGLYGDIGDIMAKLKRDQTVAFRSSTKAAFTGGVQGGITDFALARFPGYRDLGPEGVDKLSTKMFQLVDTDALDFLVNYNVQLAGDVNRELADGIKRTIMHGIATGISSDQIVANMGTVVIDQDSFKNAGGRVFSSAQWRMETIARTEIVRAHSQGRMKFHERVGVQSLEWVAMEDERMCRQCGGLDGKTYPINKFPNQPAHPLCRCLSVVAEPLQMCGYGDAPIEINGGACILPPSVLDAQADAQEAQTAKITNVFSTGSAEDLGSLSAVELRALSKLQGISASRTKDEFVVLLDAADPGVDHSVLAGKALQDEISKFRIGAMRTRDDLIKMLAEKQALLRIGQRVDNIASDMSPDTHLDKMTVVDLKALCKDQGVSTYLTKDDVVKILDACDPWVDHATLSVRDLAGEMKKFGIGYQKNKGQLIDALQRKTVTQ